MAGVREGRLEWADTTHWYHVGSLQYWSMQGIVLVLNSMKIKNSCSEKWNYEICRSVHLSSIPLQRSLFLQEMAINPETHNWAMFGEWEHSALNECLSDTSPQGSGVTWKGGGKMVRSVGRDDAKEIAFSDTIGVTHLWPQRDCDSTHKTGIGSNQTESQHGEGEADKLPPLTKKAFETDTCYGKGKICFQEWHWVYHHTPGQAPGLPVGQHKMDFCLLVLTFILLFFILFERQRERPWNWVGKEEVREGESIWSKCRKIFK